jgi:quinoprotein glucose dehydrogenase
MKNVARGQARFLRTAVMAGLTLGLGACGGGESPTAGTYNEGPGTRDGQWQYLGGDSAHTRYSPASQIAADNFEDLEEAWVWDGASFNAASIRGPTSLTNSSCAGCGK